MSDATLAPSGSRVMLASVEPCFDAWQLLLFTNDIQPAAVGSVFDLAEASFPGYQRQSPRFGPAALLPGGRGQASAFPLTWQRGSGGPAQNVYGWAALDRVSNALIALARFAGAPVPMALPGDMTPPVTLTVELGQYPPTESRFNLKFAGTDGAVTIPDSPSLSTNGNVPFTLAFWAYFDALMGASVAILGRFGMPQFQYLLHIGLGNFRFFVTGGGPEVIGPPAEPGLWYFVAAWYDTQNIYLQVDGGPIFSVPFTAGTFGVSPLVLGQRSDAPGAPHGLPGRLDDVAQFMRVLTDDERKGLARGKLDPIDLGPAGLWKFEEGVGVLAKDSSGNGNTGTLSGGVAWDNQVPPPLR